VELVAADRQPGSIAAFHARVRAKWRPPDRRRRLGAQARVSVLVSADLGRGLRLPAAVAHEQKMRRLELAAGAPRRQGGRVAWSPNKAMRQAEREATKVREGD
jgi:hypothetical protein